MRFSNEFKQWFEKVFELNFPKETNMNYYRFNFKAMYDAFNAHNEELKELRAFKKKFRKLQEKLNKYDDDDWKYMQVAGGDTVLMIERDKLTVTPDIKDPSKSTIHYKMGVEVARNNYCDTLMAYISDVNFIRPPTIEERKRKLDEQLYILESVCKRTFYELYRK